MQEKKVYETPQLTVHGDIQKITQGEGRWAFVDFFVFGFEDPIGWCKNQSCVTGSR